MIEEFRISSSTIPKDVFFGLVVDGGKAITLSELGILVQDRAGSLKLVTKAPFDIGKPQLQPPRCETRVTPEEKRRFLVRRVQALSSMQKNTQTRRSSSSLISNYS